jgi:hypothetical protein
VQDLTSLDNFPIGIRRGAALSQLPSLLQPRSLHLRIAEGEGFHPPCCMPNGRTRPEAFGRSERRHFVGNTVPTTR